MLQKKVSLEPELQITRIHDVVIIEYSCDQEDAYQCIEYFFKDAEDQAKQFAEDLQWISKIVNGSNFSFYTNDEEVIIDHSNLTSISIATGLIGCKYKAY